jgi:hypothetical protein
MATSSAVVWVAFLVSAVSASGQAGKLPRANDLIAAVRPALPFPAAAESGDVPADHNTSARWFVVWPSKPEDTRIVVRANPLHPDIQRLGADAMGNINAAVAAAERRAQAAYDKALEELRRGGKGSELDSISLDDEGVAGERIDAELEVTIEMQAAASYDLASGEPPTVSSFSNGRSWIVRVPENTYTPTHGTDRREHFRAAEARLFFGSVQRPEVARRGDEPHYHVKVRGAADAFVVIVRGNAALVTQITDGADWMQLAVRR